MDLKCSGVHSNLKYIYLVCKCVYLTLKNISEVENIDENSNEKNDSFEKARFRRGSYTNFL